VYTDSGTSVVLFLVSIVVAWLVIYTAVRAGVGHALDRTKPRLIAEAQTSAEAVHFVMSNVGTASAFDVTVRWSNRPTGEVLARAQMLGLGGRLEWTLALTPIPDEPRSVRTLAVDWANDIDPSAGRQLRALAVLVPSQLGSAQ
jgi:hypothetical protein